jgi:hypothetical protein
MIFNQPALDPEPRSPHQGHTGHEPQQSTHQRWNYEARKTTKHLTWQPQPYRNNHGESPRHNNGNNSGGNAAPREVVPGLDLPIRAFTYHRDPALPLRPQFAEGFMSFFPLGEVAYEDAFFHLRSL